jgi:hypothetical protein
MVFSWRSYRPYLGLSIVVLLALGFLVNQIVQTQSQEDSHWKGGVHQSDVTEKKQKLPATMPETIKPVEQPEPPDGNLNPNEDPQKSSGIPIQSTIPDPTEIDNDILSSPIKQDRRRRSRSNSLESNPEGLYPESSRKQLDTFSSNTPSSRYPRLCDRTYPQPFATIQERYSEVQTPPPPPSPPSSPQYGNFSPQPPSVDEKNAVKEYLESNRVSRDQINQEISSYLETL